VKGAKAIRVLNSMMGSVLAYRKIRQSEQSRVRSCLQAIQMSQSWQSRRKTESLDAAMKTEQPRRPSACMASQWSRTSTTQRVRPRRLNACPLISPGSRRSVVSDRSAKVYSVSNTCLR